jgi:peptidoglycan hydrolase-like protein with peptidoglycan-binding domain
MKKIQKVAAVVAIALAFAVAGSADAAFTRYLTVGSTGADVVELQTILEAQGYLVIPVGVSKGYFGALTKGAVAKWQAAVGLPATGYFGPLSIAKIGGAVSGNFPAGCTSAAGYSPTTGAKCDSIPSGGSNAGGNASGDLEGGAGSIDSYTILSSLNNEEVGEDEEDVEVAGLEIENSEDSDIEIKAVKLVFNEGTAGSDFEDYATEVSVWLDGKEIGRVDADRFNDDNEWTSTISLDGGIIKAGDEDAELTVAVSGISNLDSDDATDTWTVDFRQVRFEDAEGTVISEDPSTAVVTFSFDTFASASDIELQVSLADESPNSKIVDVDDSDDTDGVTIAVFELEAEGGDIEIKDLPVTFTVTNPAGSGATLVEDVINNAILVIDGEEYSETISASGGLAATTTFDDIDYTIEEGDTVTVEVKVDVNDTQATDFVDGDTIKAEITTTNRNNIDAEDETGEDLATGDMTGTALGDEIAFYDSGIMVEFVSANAEAQADDGNDDDTGIFTIKFKVTAFDATAYVASTSAATGTLTTNVNATSLLGNLYAIDKGGSATTSNVSSAITFADSKGDAELTSNSNIELEDGEAAVVTLTVTRQNAGGTADNGLYRALLRSVAWATSEAPTAWNAYDFDLEDYKTDPISLD